MINSIRKKFVVVTVSLLVLCFGIMAVLEYQYTAYWFDYDTVYMLDSFADSGYFQSEEYVKNSIVEGYSKDYTPVVGVIVDTEGNIVFEGTAGNEKGKVLDDEIVRSMIRQKDRSWKIGSVLFTTKLLDDGNTLIVYTDTDIGQYSKGRYILLGIFCAIGIAALVMVASLLSRFVTSPAAAAIKREKQFLSDASHELKTPIGAININAQAAAMAHPDDINISNVVTESARMGRLVERMLSLSRLEETALARQERILLTEIAEGMVLTYEGSAYERNVTIKSDIGKDIYIFGDEDEIRQLMAILLDNAIKNSPENEKIKVSLRKELNKVILQISNKGKQLSKEDQSHIFERFYTGDPSHNSESFGLGLPIAKAIVERHGGNIGVRSDNGARIIFTVVFGINKNI